MKRKILLSLGGLALIGIGFAIGSLVQHGKSGFHFEVREMKHYDSEFGPIRWSYVTESVGLPLLDPGTTIIEFDGRTIYKAKRGYQESSPFARNIQPTDDGVTWDDGDFSFELAIHPLTSGTQSEATNH